MRHFLETIFNCRWLPLTCIVILISVSGRAIGGASKDPATPAFKVAIEKHPNALQGHYSPVDIRLHSGQDRITGFSFLIAYDTTQLRLRLSEPGGFLKSRGWANFSVEPSGADSNLAFIRVVGSIGVNGQPDSSQRSSNGLAHFIFFVKDDRPLECRLLPVRFLWNTCDDNVIRAGSDGTAYYARSIIDAVIPYADMYNPPGDCFLDSRKTPPIPEPCRDPGSCPERRTVDYVNGGIDVVCLDSGGGLVGDVDQNGLPCESTDMAALARLLVYVEFCPDLSDSIQEVMRQAYRSPFDQNHLSISSLAFFARCIVGDLPRFVEAGNDSVAIAARVSRDSMFLFARPSAPLGALMLTFACDKHLTTPLISSSAFGARTCRAAHDGRLCLIVYWPQREALIEGKYNLGAMVLPGVKRLIGAEAVDYYSRPVRTIIK